MGVGRWRLCIQRMVGDDHGKPQGLYPEVQGHGGFEQEEAV